MNAKDLKLVVKEKYSEIANQTKQQNESSCCGASGCCSTVDYAVFSEIMRVLKPDGHFCVSDVVIKGNLPEKLRKDAEMYAGCVSGAIDISEYLGIINMQGFKDVSIHTQKEVALPDEVLAKYLTNEEITRFKRGETGIFSITVSGYKQF
jgi:SAM-dependent methyltransferase